ncbi:MAG: hypothetical protein NC548_39660 [Lachnospiraceae bacterium]|nr:hypothetical protein [Lachnospiraceae bacterium]
MDMQKVIACLEGLREFCRRMGVVDGIDSIWVSDCESLDVAIAAVKKQIAKKPNVKKDKCTDLIEYYSCPVCGKYFGQAGVHNAILFDKPEYCSCGQRIGWSEK